LLAEGAAEGALTAEVPTGPLGVVSPKEVGACDPMYISFPGNMNRTRNKENWDFELKLKGKFDVFLP
jgi:hypothetical protein